MSFTKTLVPRSPSGINIIGECDIFYPLQTKISDWYPTKPPPPPAPAEYEEDEEEKQPVLPANVGPIPPNNPPMPVNNPAMPLNDQANGNYQIEVIFFRKTFT